MKIKTYAEMMQYSTFEDRLHYLMLSSTVGAETFGFDRYLNQKFYRSREWKNLRHAIILRDNACDLATPGFEIYENMLIHHMNPLVKDDIVHGSDALFDPENLITTTQQTHNAIHYGYVGQYRRTPIERKPGDTSLW